MEPIPADTEAVLAKSVINASRWLGLADAALANTLGLTEAEVARMAQGTRFLNPESSEGCKALQLVRLYRALDALVGMEQQTVQVWMRSHNEALGDTPQRRIQTPEGLVATLEYLGRMAGKG